MAAFPTARDVGHSRGPILSVSEKNLSNCTAIVWNQGKTKINRILGDVPLETWNERSFRPISQTWIELSHPSPSDAWIELSHPSPSDAWVELPYPSPSKTWNQQPCRPPYEIVEAITAHLTRNLDTLKACSLICRTWYLAAVPHLHRTLILSDMKPDKSHAKLKPLSKLHELDLTTFVKEIQVWQGSNEDWFIPQAFSPNDLSYFSAFANVESLVLRNMDISRFIPNIQGYFKHFAPVLQSITLHTPRCTPRQLSHFLSIFSNLDDIHIHFPERPFNTNVPDTKFIPLSSPKLRGRLELSGFRWVETWTDLIASCDGLRFCHVDLHHPTGCAPILLGACAETLETLQFLVGEFSLSLPGFSLSRLKVLQSLQVGGWATIGLPENRHRIVTDIFSSITSPVFSELVIILRDDSTARLPSDVTLFETLRTMNEVRPFKLVFLVRVLGLAQVAQRKLAEALDQVNEQGFLDFLDSPPTVRWA